VALRRALPGAHVFIPEDHLPVVREAFRSFDTAGSGDITTTELAGLLRALRLNVSETELAGFVEGYAKDGRLDYPTVLDVVGQAFNSRRGLSAVLKAFKEFDDSGSGTITVATFRSILLSMGAHDAEKGGVAFVDAATVDEMVAHADPDETGIVEYEKWARELMGVADGLARKGMTPAQARKALKDAADEKGKGKSKK
jgi:Ca2+-binding EF-hand superfamily protein